MSVRGYIQTLLNALPFGTRQPVQQAFDALYTERSGVTPGTYGSSLAIPVLTIDWRGRVTAASESTFASGGSTSVSTVVGNRTYSSAAGNEPSAQAGDLYFPTDGFRIERYSGSAWVPWGPIFPLTDPTIAAPTTWVNQGGATVSSSRGPIVLTTNGGVSVALRAKSAPATPYTITIVCYVTTTAAFGQMQFGFRESTSGKLSGLGVMPSGNVEIQKWNSPTSFNSNYTTFGALLPSAYAKGPIFLQISDDGTTRYYRVSGDNGLTWRTAHSVGRTDFLTADQVYFGVDNESGGSPYTVMTLMSWEET